MPNKNLTDNEILKALEDKIEFENFDENGYAIIDIEKLKLTLDLINRQKAENKSQSIMIKMLKGSIEDYKNSYINQKAEIERLKNAYEQVAWERDIFAEDMKEEIKKYCSYLMLDIKTIKAEARKEFAERVIQTLEMFNAAEMAGVSKEYDNRYFCENPMAWKEGSTTARNEVITIINNLLKEMEGEDK